ncbi:Inositol phosphorylceramide synthase catalytic subunit aur1 [Porphyridium purpureum]|uniref:Inositol phosphorylceramide synthase catalytic subunit aur1 n=1 Tax=Porphyridium purpureum TaxID=35688 RepID=A0A5J4Z210_PORPP|nr:Inositol phosphorylceramide synthase catalytic subunit aur1 [Porphyridium purpureum]|eukprot:POR6049..scf208_2
MSRSLRRSAPNGLMNEDRIEPVKVADAAGGGAVLGSDDSEYEKASKDTGLNSGAGGSGVAPQSPRSVVGSNFVSRGARAVRQTVIRTLEGISIQEILISFAPVLAWLILYAVLAGQIPGSVKPRINVTVLPKIEALLLYPHRWFNRSPHTVFDVLAALPYTLHPVLPLINLVRVVARSGARRGLVFARCFGTMCFLGVLTQLVLPIAPPWYFEKYGFQPADYSMKGDAAMLARVDRLAGNQHYQGIYGLSANPIVFGSFPSLHGAWPYLIAAFEPSPGWPMWAYTFWVWWAALYLQHHFLTDLLGSAIYAEVALFVLGDQGLTLGMIVQKFRASRNGSNIYRQVRSEEVPDREANGISRTNSVVADV